MPMELHRILLIEDNVADTELTVREMKRGGLAFDWRRVETEADVRRACAEFVPTVVLSDFAMPQFDGLSALRVVRELRPEVPFIFVSGTIGEETAIQSLRSGAGLTDDEIARCFELALEDAGPLDLSPMFAAPGERKKATGDRSK